jgi:hypothetical protein
LNNWEHRGEDMYCPRALLKLPRSGRDFFFCVKDSPGCGHTHVLHSAYRSQFALCRWDQPSDRTLLFPLDTMISPTEFENPTSDASSGERTQKKRKRGLGKGGAAANYCTMSVASRMAQFPNEPFEERVGSLNQSVMWCLGCGKPVSHQTRNFGACH